MNKYLFTRTDRIGDFLLSVILFKAIKRNDKMSHITVIASTKNFDYIKKNDFVDEVLLYPSNNFIKKIFFLMNNFNNKYYMIGSLDGKKRSIYMCLLFKAKFKILCTYKTLYKKIFKPFFNLILLDKEYSKKIDEINKILSLLNYELLQNDLNTLEPYKKNNFLSYTDFNMLHFDEKWIHNNYISSYKNIEPSFDELFTFIKSIVIKTNKNLVITTGILQNELVRKIYNKGNHINSNLSNIKLASKNIFILNNLTIFDLQDIISNASTLITCHGAASHMGASMNKKIIDIIDDSELIFFNKWTAHFKNYNQINRTNFSSLSNKVFQLL